MVLISKAGGPMANQMVNAEKFWQMVLFKKGWLKTGSKNVNPYVSIRAS